LVQPVDHKVAALIKRQLQAEYVKALQTEFAQWRDYRTTASAISSSSARRVQMARWLNDTWKKIKVEQTHLLEQSFAQTVLIKKDGSHTIQLPGVEKYDFLS